VKEKSVEPRFPSLAATSLMDTVGTSSFTIVPTAWPSRIDAFEGFDKETKNVSSGSIVPSPVTPTVMVLVVSPWANDSTPELAV
jgi:hypothetical protein